MFLSTWKKINLSRIIIFSLAYIAYALFLVLSHTGIYIINILLLVSSVFNGGGSLVVFFIDDEERYKTAKKISKRVRRLMKLAIQVLKVVILVGSFVIYSGKQSDITLALAICMLAITLIGYVFDFIKYLMIKKAKETVKALDKKVEHVKDALHLSRDWNVVFLEDGTKLRFKAKEDVEWWTKYTLRKKKVEDESLVKYNGKLVFFANKDDVKYVTDVRDHEQEFAAIAKHLTDYKYKEVKEDEDTISSNI